jgi:hypothetical protein
MSNKRVIRIETEPVRADEGDGFPGASTAPMTRAAEPASSYVPPPPTAAKRASDSGRSAIVELRDLCEAAMLAPAESPLSDPLAALELRSGAAPEQRQPRTASWVADQLVQRLKAMPQVRARVVAQLINEAEPPQAVTQVHGNETQAALKELRQVRNLLDNLGAPRSEDDRNLTVMERVRWLLDVLTASQQARAAAGTARVPFGDNTPATGVNPIVPDAGQR